ncbi:MAG: TonB-dependent receptor [Bacteroidales bacterium]|nr:TonB-dependent receptor [Bacteroidales bacterium]
MLRRNFLIISSLIIIVFCVSINLNAQKININIHEKPLNEVFLELRDNYGVQFSFNDKLLSNCIVSDSGSYDSPRQVISKLTKSCNLAFEINKNVFIIFAKEEELDVPKEKVYLFSGHISDKLNKETLPFSNIQFNSSGLISDLNGNFSFKSNDSIANLKASHIGYFLLDTILPSGTNQELKMMPSIVGLEEVVVNSEVKAFYSHIGEKSGLIKLNHKISSFLPGNNDNTIFNLLRLQPGILAAAEHTDDYIIWGSYKGQNLILFDGIPLFSISSLNDKIGVINPLIIKDVEIMKGGYNSNIGGRVGGVINITAKSGNPEKFSANANINNQTVSGLAGIPIAGKYSLQLSFRQSYRNFLNWNDILKTKEGNKSDTYKPDHDFQDMNIKFSGRTTKGDNFYVSLLTENDRSSYKFSKDEDTKSYSLTKELEQKQLGGAIFYNNNWEKAGITNTTIAYSGLISNSFDSLNYYEPAYDSLNVLFTENSISEFSIKTDHHFPAFRKHSLSMGLKFTNNRTGYRQDSTHITQKNRLTQANRLSYYLLDNITINKNINIQPGLRIDFPANISKPYFQPRIDATIKPLKNWKINLAWGVFNQFISENALIDDLNNYSYFWSICNNKNISVLKGVQYITGISFTNKGFNYSLEGYYKTTNGLNRFIYKDNSSQLKLYHGKGRSYGVDFYIRKIIKNHEFWVTYSLSKTEEKFNYLKNNEFHNAPQDQRHEIKGAALFNFNPFFISINYVYGSGLASSLNFKDFKTDPYSRFDLAFLYKFNVKRIKFESGLSIINLLNTNNVRYNDFSNLPGGKTIYSEAMPITPTLFLNIGF